MMDKSQPLSPYYRPQKDQLPKSARYLSEGEVLRMQMARVEKAPAQLVWPLMYGNFVLSGAAGVTTVALLMRMRRPFKLGGLGLITSVIPSVGLAVIPNFLMSSIGITQEIVTGQFNKCVECAQVRATAYQLFTGLGYPMIFTPLVAYGALRKFKTVPLPAFYPFKDFRVNYARLFLRPAAPILLASAVVQTALTCYVVKKQFGSFVWLMNQDDSLVHTR